MRHLPVDTRYLAAGILAIVAAAIVMGITEPAPTTEVLELSETAAPGVRLGELVTTTRRVMDPTGLVTADEADDLLDRVLRIPLEAGTPIPTGALATDATPVVDVIGLELDSARAVHGALEPGDAVDIFTTGDDAVEMVAGAVPVVGVFAETDTLRSGEIGLLLAVDDRLAPLIVGAAATGSMHLVRTGG